MKISFEIYRFLDAPASLQKQLVDKKIEELYSNSLSLWNSDVIQIWSWFRVKFTDSIKLQKNCIVHHCNTFADSFKLFRSTTN